MTSRIVVVESPSWRDRGAEVVARRRGCHGIWLNTFAFRAKGFDEKLGFTVFGVLVDDAVGSGRFVRSKVL